MRESRRNAQFLRHLVYDLKRDYGFPVLIVKTVSTTVDLESGTKVPVSRYRDVRRAIFLPSRSYQSFVYNLTYVASNKNFVEGAFFNPTDRVIFIDYRDVEDFEIIIDDRILYKNQEYIVTEVRDFIEATIYGVKMRHVSGQILDDPSSQVIAETITTVDIATGVKS